MSHTKTMTKQFKIVKPGTDDDVLGPVSETNVYISAYPRPEVGQKHPLKLEVSESTLCVYNLSGQRGTYRVIRLRDEVVRNYHSANGITGYEEGDILVCDDTGERSLVVRDGRGLCLKPVSS